MTAKTTTADFFQNQARALRKTGLLVLLFCIAVLLIILAVYFVVTTMAYFFLTGDLGAKQGTLMDFYFQPKVFAAVAGATILVIGGGTLFKILSLRKGGSAVAGMLGAVPVAIDTKDQDERKLLNVIEEMSIASGCPHPSVYLLKQERGINAFAAGFTQSDAAITVTEGAIKHLSRPELQGVIAHEFSHIVNGDMRLNINLMGVVHGIQQIGLVGKGIMFASLGADSSHRGRGRRGADPRLLAAGAVIFLVGLIGLLFARIIKAAVSRQREYLADAAAVQYTRYPEGIAGALKKIGGLESGSRVYLAQAEQASHFFFGNALKAGQRANASNVLSTHPPLPKRIRNILPSWDGTFPAIKDIEFPSLKEAQGRARTAEPPKPPKTAPLPGGQPGQMPPVMPPTAQQGTGGQQGPVLPPGAGGAQGAPQQRMMAIGAAAILSQVGQIRPEGIEHAQGILRTVPDSLRSRVRRVGGAMGTLFALLIREDEASDQEGLKKLPTEWRFEAEQALGETKGMGAPARLALIDLALPALRKANPDESGTFLRAVEDLIQSDQKTTLLELAIEVLVRKQLDPETRKRTMRGPQYYSITPLVSHIGLLLSSLAHSSGDNRSTAQEAFSAGASSFGEKASRFQLAEKASCSPKAIRAAFIALAQASPHVKKRVLEACVRAVNADEKLTEGEAMLLRAVGGALDLPMPPLAGRSFPVDQY